MIRVIVGHVAMFSGTCLDASALWHVGEQKLLGQVLAIRDCNDLAWVFTHEWVLSIYAAKIST